MASNGIQAGQEDAPAFPEEDAPALGADLEEVARYAKDRGNLLKGTTTQRNAHTPKIDGLFWADTTDGTLYRCDGTSWYGVKGSPSVPTYESSTWAAASDALQFWVNADGSIGVEGGFQNVGSGVFNAGFAATRVGVVPAAVRPSRTVRMPASQLRAAAGEIYNHATLIVEADGEVYVSLSATDTYTAGALKVYVCNANAYRPA